MQLNAKHFPELFRNDYAIAVVTFDQNGDDCVIPVKRGPQKEYNYKVPTSLELKAGDKLLVCVISHGYPTYKAVTVQRVLSASEGLDAEAAFSYKWAIGKLDDILIDYHANVKRDADVTAGLKLLTSALNRVQTQKQLALAMELLSEAEREQVNSLLGLNAVAPITAG